MVNRSFADMRRTPVSPASCRAFFSGRLRSARCSHSPYAFAARVDPRSGRWRRRQLERPWRLRYCVVTLPLLLAANHHRAVLDVRTENSADRATRGRTVVDVLRNDVIAVVAADLARAFVALGPTGARVTAAAVDRKARIAAWQVSHGGGAGTAAEAAQR